MLHRLLLIAVGAVMLTAWTALADVSKTATEVDTLSRQLASIETNIEEKKTDDAGLVDLKVRLDALSRQIISLGVSLRPRLAEINGRLETLGAPPKEGEPGEVQSVSDERRALLAEKAEYNAVLGRAEDLSIRASRASDRIGALRREIFSNTLFKRTEIGSALISTAISDFRSEMAALSRHVTARLQFLYNFRRQALLFATGLSLFFGLLTVLGIRRLLRSEALQAVEDAGDSYIGKLSRAFWATVIPALAAVAGLGVAYGLFAYFGVFTPQLRDVAESLLISIAAIFFVHRLAGSIFAPRRPVHRLIPVTDGAALVLYLLALAIALLQVLDYFLGRVNAAFASPLTLTVVKSLATSLVISVLLVLVALVKPFRDAVTGHKREWPTFVRTPLILMALFIIVAAVSGYVGLARFTAAQVVVTGAILATMFIGVQSGQVLAAEGALSRSTAGKRAKAWFSVSDTALDQLGLLLSFVIYGAVIAAGLPLILLQWGFNKIDIQSWLYRALTDITIGTVSISLVGIVFGIGLFIVGFLATRRFQVWLDRTVMARSRVDAGVRNSIRTIVGYAGIALAAMMGLSAAGFDLSNLAIVAGALSLGIGFGLQNVVNNFVSGLILLAERPFKVGDWIEAGTTAGTVRKISVRATEIETFHHQRVILPNSELINSAVGNWTLRNAWGRVDIPLGVAYGADARRVMDLLLAVAKREPAALRSPEPFVMFKGFGDSSLEFELRVHIADVLEIAAVSTRLRLDILETLEKNGIGIPYPQRDVNLRIAEIEALSDAIDKVKARRKRPGKR